MIGYLGLRRSLLSRMCQVIKHIDIGRLRIVMGQRAEVDAGPPGSATITSVLNDHAESVADIAASALAI